MCAHLTTSSKKAKIHNEIIKKAIITLTLLFSWYTCSIILSMYNKWMFSSEYLNFHFPLFTTVFHFLIQFSLSALVLHFFPHFKPPKDASMSIIEYIRRIVICGFATGGDIGMGNMSLQFITLSFYTMIKSSNLIFVLLFSFLFKLERPNLILLLIILVISFGVMLMVLSETAFNLLGFLLVLFASILGGLRWSLTQLLLKNNPSTHNPFATLYYLAPVMAASLFIFALFVEGIDNLISAPLWYFPKQQAQSSSSVSSSYINFSLSSNSNPNNQILQTSLFHILKSIFFLLIPGFFAFFMTVSEFALIQKTSVVTLSVGGMFKEVLTICFSSLVFGDKLTKINVSGLIITLCAIGAYNYVRIGILRKQIAGKLTNINSSSNSPSNSPPLLSSSTFATNSNTSLTPMKLRMISPESYDYIDSLDVAIDDNDDIESRETKTYTSNPTFSITPFSKTKPTGSFSSVHKNLNPRLKINTNGKNLTKDLNTKDNDLTLDSEIENTTALPVINDSLNSYSSTHVRARSHSNVSTFLNSNNESSPQKKSESSSASFTPSSYPSPLRKKNSNPEIFELKNLSDHSHSS